jgi:hypothetical protein
MQSRSIEACGFALFRNFAEFFCGTASHCASHKDSFAMARRPNCLAETAMLLISRPESQSLARLRAT